ncbi:MAG: hypothetical protein IPJ77_08090 [Planctomycetes bacterium]|nr:hypothetical protein [Planctomycetota bacterium]
MRAGLAIPGSTRLLAVTRARHARIVPDRGHAARVHVLEAALDVLDNLFRATGEPDAAARESAAAASIRVGRAAARAALERLAQERAPRGRSRRALRAARPEESA